MADNLVSIYKAVAVDDWKWYEPYLTYANSLLPEAMLFAAKATDNNLYRIIAKESFEFLLSVTYLENEIKVVTNQGGIQQGRDNIEFGEQPIEIAYTILALDSFYRELNDVDFLHKMEIAFDWFLGRNHLNQIIYNPCTGGCCDGLEQYHVNLNQGAESTVSYILARLTVEKYIDLDID